MLHALMVASTESYNSAYRLGQAFGMAVGVGLVVWFLVKAARKK